MRVPPSESSGEMTDEECVDFLKWCLPRLRLRWPGFRKVRRTVCKRVQKRIRALGLGDVAAYRLCLEQTPQEWSDLDALCRIPRSRFYRDGAVFDFLGDAVLPELARAGRARGEKVLRAWSAGSASGEEPYTLAIIWGLSVEPGFPEVTLRIQASEVDETLVERARQACYQAGSLKEMPRAWLAGAFTESDGLFFLRPAFRDRVAVLRQDIREALPDGPFDLILCRNLVFTYFDAGSQSVILGRVLDRLVAGGALVIGNTEDLPQRPAGLSHWGRGLGVYRKAGPAD